MTQTVTPANDDLKEVRKHIRRHAPEFAKTMVGQLVEQSAKGYGISVQLRLPGD